MPASACSRRRSHGVPRQPEDHHAYRTEGAVWLCRLVADLAVRQQRGEAVRRQGRALGAVLLHRSAATDRCRLSWCIAGFVAADAGLSATAAVFRCGEGPAGEIRHAGIRSKEGRCAAVGQGLQEGLQRLLDRPAGQASDGGHHRLRRRRSGHRPGIVGDAEAARRRRRR